MAGGGNNAVKTVLLLLLIIMISAGGLVWFDYLNVIDLKTLMAPVLNRLGRQGRSQKLPPPSQISNLDADRFTVLMEGIDLRSAELNNEEKELGIRRGEIEQMAAELEERQRGLDDREKSLKAEEDATAAKDKNIRQFVEKLNAMPPDSAVRILIAMDDQDMIECFRKAELMAAEAGGASMVSVWLMNQQFPPARAAELFRKMAERP